MCINWYSILQNLSDHIETSINTGGRGELGEKKISQLITTSALSASSCVINSTSITSDSVSMIEFKLLQMLQSITQRPRQRLLSK